VSEHLRRLTYLAIIIVICNADYESITIDLLAATYYKYVVNTSIDF